VNDAWLFDKKWKQIMVTISGGYVEFFIGSLCAFVWAFTSEGSAINLLSFQVMTICSVSTVMFNFNPLMKLDGYYLLSDFLEVPNLKEDAGKYIKHIVRTKLFSMPSNEFDSATKWEKKVYFFYGLASATWMFFLLTGLVGMAHGILVDKLNGLGVLLTGFIAYKIFKGHVVGSFKFLAEWAISKKSYWSKSWVRFSMGGALASIFVLLFVPVHYKVRGNCKLAPSQVRVVRAEVSAKLTKFLKNDGEQIVIGDQLAQLENAPVNFERKIAAVAVKKARQTLRKAMVDTPHKVAELKSELNGKLLELKQKNDSFEKLKVTFHESLGPKMVLSCSEQQSITQSFVQKGDEICRVMEISKLKTVIEVSEQEIRFMGPGQKVAFKLISGPIKTYYGVIEKVRPTGKSDPKNPKHKVYQLDISIENTGGLLPGMNGVAKVYANEVSLAKYGLMKLAMGLRLDLFY
jgi:putative peptide zinc metalloprotease protein